MTALAALDRVVGRLLRWGSVALLGLVFVLLIINAFLRFFPIVQLGWFDEVVELLVAWMVFLGAAALWREHEHFAITFFPDLFRSKPSGRVLDVVLNLLALFFVGVFTWYSLNLTLRVGDWTPVINMPKKLLYASMPVSGLFMIAYSLRDVFVSGRKLAGRGTC
jgi:TRAP-type C4-dicarboxylate transport system permease small subunit